MSNAFGGLRIESKGEHELKGCNKIQPEPYEEWGFGCVDAHGELTGAAECESTPFRTR